MGFYDTTYYAGKASIFINQNISLNCYFTMLKKNIPLKILHLIDSEGIYGAEMVVLNLISYQIKNNITPIIGSICGKDYNKGLDIIGEKLKISVVRFSAARGVDIIAGFKILNWAKRNNVTLIHTHGFKPNLLTVFFPKWWREIPIVRTLHGWTNLNKFSKLGVYQKLDIMSLHFTERLIAVTNAMLRVPPLVNSSLNIDVIENGIAPPNIEATLLENSKNDSIYNFSNNSHMLLSIGRLSEEKGFFNLITAVSQLIKEGVDLKLCIIGEGPQRKLLENLIAKLGVKENIFLPGYRDSAYRFIPFFNTFILSSYTEGLPISLLEAMHVGIPVFATRVGGIPEALDYGNAGFLIDNNDPNLISYNLKVFIMNFHKRNEFVQAAQKRAQTIYSSEAMGRKYTKAYFLTLSS